ncbi:phage upper tail fiber protein [Flavobacterium sp.]|uniref:phage upper tail fiber protein n=1 Tax=Flavobacterium sp. TaxID=239 RepID=UPI004034C18B
MVIIQNIDDNTFLFNNRKYVKKYLVLKLGNTHIAIHNAYDVRMQLLESTHYSQVQVDGEIYDSQEALMSVLAPLLFNSGGNTSGSTQNNKAAYIQCGIVEGEGEITPAQLATFINAQEWSFVVSETTTPVLFEALRTSDGITKKYIFIFLQGKGKWGSASGSNPNPVYSTFFKLISVQNLTPDDIDEDENSQINYLGEIDDGDFVNVANATEWAFTSTTEQYYFSYTTDDVLYFALFIGEPGTYGGGSLDTNDFTEDDFVITTNSSIPPVGIPNLQQVLNESSTATTPNYISIAAAGFQFGVSGVGSIALTPTQTYFGGLNGAIHLTTGGTEINTAGYGFQIYGGAGGQINTNPANGISINGNAGGITLNGSSQGINLNGQGGGIRINGGSQGLTLAGSAIKFSGESYTIFDRPFNYFTDVSSGYTNRSLVDKGYVLSLLSGVTSGSNSSWGSITGTLSAQTDLQTTLSTKGKLSGGNTWVGNQTVQGKISASAATTGTEVVVLSQLDRYLYLDSGSPNLVKSCWYGSKSEYEALGSYDPNVVYNINNVEFRGSLSLSANGTTTISISHGLGSTPSWLTVDAKNSNAGGFLYKTADSTKIYITYSSAPSGMLEYWVAYNS